MNRSMAAVSSTGDTLSQRQHVTEVEKWLLIHAITLRRQKIFVPIADDLDVLDDLDVPNADDLDHSNTNIQSMFTLHQRVKQNDCGR